MSEIYSLDDLREFSYEEIFDLKKNVETVFVEKQGAKRNENLEKITALAKEVNLSLEDLTKALGPTFPKPSSSGRAPRRQTKPSSKHYHLPETDKNWTGRGKMPDKIKEYLGKGGKLEDLEIKPASPGEGE